MLYDPGALFLLEDGKKKATCFSFATKAVRGRKNVTLLSLSRYRGYSNKRGSIVLVIGGSRRTTAIKIVKKNNNVAPFIRAKI
jgi:hypothetical protein